MDNQRLDNAIELNNQGVELLLQNQDTEAVTCFTRALGMVKHVLLQPSSSESSSSSSSGEDSSSSSTVDRYSDNLHSDVYAVPSFQTSAANAGLGFVYHGAITLSSSVLSSSSSSSSLNSTSSSSQHEQRHEEEPQDQEPQEQQEGSRPIRVSEAHMNIYSAAIIYNIALVYHRQGVKYCKNVCLEKAEKMYDMLLKLVGYSGDIASLDESMLPQDGTALLLRIAAINNCSLIRLDKGDYDFPRHGFHHLSRVLTSLGNDNARALFENLLISTSSSSDNDDVDNMSTDGPLSMDSEDDEEVIQGMLLNVLLAKSPDAAPAA